MLRHQAAENSVITFGASEKELSSWRENCNCWILKQFKRTSYFLGIQAWVLRQNEKQKNMRKRVVKGNSFPDLLWTKPKARSGKVRKFGFFDWLLHLTPVQSPLWRGFPRQTFFKLKFLPGNFRGWWKWKADKKRREEKRFGSSLPLGIEQLLQHDRTVSFTVVKRLAFAWTRAWFTHFRSLSLFIPQNFHGQPPPLEPSRY